VEPQPHQRQHGRGTMSARDVVLARIRINLPPDRHDLPVVPDFAKPPPKGHDSTDLRHGVLHACRLVLALHGPLRSQIDQAASPRESLSFMFWGAGVFVLPPVPITHRAGTRAVDRRRTGGRQHPGAGSHAVMSAGLRYRPISVSWSAQSAATTRSGARRAFMASC
jgi:hypothetical protein